jgi:hypothetical protein
MTQNTHDQDKSKGATEDDNSTQPGNAALQGQLGHRDPDPIIKDADSDFPEPGNSPEHSGEPGETATTVTKRKIPA